MTESNELLIAQPTVEILMGWESGSGRKKIVSKSLKDFAGENFTVKKSCQVVPRIGQSKTVFYSYNDFVVILKWQISLGNKKALDFNMCMNLPIDADILLKSKTFQVSTKEKRAKQGYLYLLDSGTVLKLGYTANVEKRIRAIERWDGELELIATIRGTINLEQAIHRYLRATGEYYGNEWYPVSRKAEILNVLNLENLKRLKQVL